MFILQDQDNESIIVSISSSSDMDGFQRSFRVDSLAIPAPRKFSLSKAELFFYPHIEYACEMGTYPSR